MFVKIYMPRGSIGVGENLQTQIQPGASAAAFLQQILCYRRNRRNVRAWGEFPDEAVTRGCLYLVTDVGIKAVGIV